jgi:hypothetical protein
MNAMDKMPKVMRDYVTGAADLPDGALMAFKSHIEGRNALVTVWPDRIEWSRKPLLSFRHDTNTIMVRMITGIRSHKASLGYTTVEIASGTSTVAMRVTKSQASELRRVITEAQANSAR